MLPIRILGDRVLVLLPPKEHEQDETTGFTFQRSAASPSGLILAKPADVYNRDIANRGMVVSLGEQSGTVSIDDVLAVIDELQHETSAADLRAAMKTLGPAPFDVQVGDCVVFPTHLGDQFDYEGHSYVILRESDIAGVLERADQKGQTAA